MKYARNSKVKTVQHLLQLLGLGISIDCTWCSGVARGGFRKYDVKKARPPIESELSTSVGLDKVTLT